MHASALGREAGRRALGQTGPVERPFDHVIVGGGAAGCVLANRLSTDPSDRVLVLEAGRPDYLWDVFIHMPAALTYPIGGRWYDWKYESEPEPHMGGRRIYHARGKVLGGSSSINGMIFQRGNPMDYERWASGDGMETWDYAHCLPYFKKMENCLAAAPDNRRVAVGTLNGEVYLVEAATGKRSPLSTRSSGPIRQLAFQPGGKVLAITDQTSAIKVYDLDSERGTVDQVPNVQFS